MSAWQPVPRRADCQVARSEPMAASRNRAKTWRTAGELSAVGLTLAIATAIGYFLGDWIGGMLGSRTWGGALGVLVGAAAGFTEMFRTLRRYLRELEEEDRRKSELR